MVTSISLMLSSPLSCSLVPSILNQDLLYGPSRSQDFPTNKNEDMQSVLSLDDGRLSLPVEEATSVSPGFEEEFSQLNIRQPSPPPVMAQVHPQHRAISTSTVADLGPGIASSSTGRYQNLHVVNSYCSLFTLFWYYYRSTALYWRHESVSFFYPHFICICTSFFTLIDLWMMLFYILPTSQPVTLMECFLRVAEANTANNLETCGILAGTLVWVIAVNME